MSNKKIKIFFIRNFTIDPLFDHIQNILKKKHLNADFFVSSYDNATIEVLNKNSEIYRIKPDLIFVFLNIDSDIDFLDSKEKSRFFSNFNKNINIISSNLKKINSKICFFNIPNLENSDQETYIFFRKTNELIKKISNKNSYGYLDLASYVYQVGYENFYSYKFWKLSMFPFKELGIDILSKIITKYIFLLYGYQHKLLILDGDNTLWGGILGEDGIKNLKIGDNYPGIFYKNFQKLLIKFKKKGILLALCTKNNLHNIKELFKSRKKDLILKLSDFSAVQSNWQPKYQNINLILKKLNLSAKNSIFIDDSLFEINSVKKIIREIDTLLMPNNASDFNRNLLDFVNINSFNLTAEDKKRAQLYVDEDKRSKEKEKYSSFIKYVKNLKIILNINCNSTKDIERLSQLTQKTNQFNTTTIRLSSDQMLQLIKNPKNNTDIIYCRAKDKFGDMGIIGLAMISIYNDKAVLKNLLFSCRALGRFIEDAFLQYIFKYILNKNIFNIECDFILNKNNKIAFNFFVNNNFKLINLKKDNYVFKKKVNKSDLNKKLNLIKII